MNFMNGTDGKQRQKICIRKYVPTSMTLHMNDHDREEIIVSQYHKQKHS